MMKRLSFWRQAVLSLMALLLAFVPGQAAQAANNWIWKAAGALDTARSNHTATLLSNNKVLVAGGYDANNGYLSSAELYDPGNGKWNLTGSLPSARANHTATLLETGKVLVAGGYGKNGYMSSAVLYDPGMGSWKATGALKNARYGHSATLLSDGRALVVGGSGNGGRLASAELYNPATRAWTLTGSLAAARANHTATLLSNGKVLVAGGYNGTNYLATAEIYDPATGLWATTGSLKAGRSNHTATLLINGKVLIAGGDNGKGFLASAELYTPSKGTWAATGAMKASRAVHSATLLSSGKVLVAGGRGSSNLSSAELFDPSTGVWAATESMNNARASFVATLLADGNVLVTGGRGTAGLLTAAEMYAMENNSQTINVTTSTPTSAVYGTSFKVAATATSGLPVTYSAAGACTNNGATFTMTSGQGTCFVMFDQAGGNGYAAARQVKQKVAAKTIAIKVKADAQTKIYGDPDPDLTYKITSGELLDGNDFTGKLKRQEGESVGKYAINKGTLALDATYYTLTFTSSDLTITKLPVTVTATAKSKVYGYDDPALTYKITDGYLVAGDFFKGKLTRVAGENVGTYKIQQGSLAINNNYILTFVGANFIINKRPITVTADAKTKLYGESDPGLTYQITSGRPVAGDVFKGALTREAGESVGVYPIKIGTLALGSNYELTFVGADLTILAVPYNQVTFISKGAHDGLIVESSETSGVGGAIYPKSKTFKLGDDTFNSQFRAILSFDTSDLPDNAIITTVTLRIKTTGALTGNNPFSVLGRLMLDISSGPFGDTALEPGDFQAAASAARVGTFNKTPVDGWYRVMLKSAGISNINPAGVTQFRLYFSKDDNNNHRADFLAFYSGNNTTNKPELIIRYTVP